MTLLRDLFHQFVSWSSPPKPSFAAMSGGDAANTNAYSGPGAPDAGREAWTFSFSGDPDVSLLYGATCGSPVPFEGKVYFVVSSSDFGMPPVSRDEVRRRTGPLPPAPNGALAVLHAVDAATGALKWRFPLGAPAREGTPAVSDGRVFVSSAKGGLWALHADSGREIWSHQIKPPARLRGIPNLIFGGDDPTVSSSTAPRVAEGLLYFAGAAGWSSNNWKHIFALDPRNGSVRWKEFTDSGVGAIANSSIYAYVEEGTLLSLNARTGRRRWVFEADDSAGFWTSPAVGDDFVYIASTVTHKLCALRRAQSHRK